MPAGDVAAVVKGKRAGSYDERQLAIIVAGMEQGHGQRRIVSDNKGAGLTEAGVKTVLRRLRWGHQPEAGLWWAEDCSDGVCAAAGQGAPQCEPMYQPV